MVLPASIKKRQTADKIWDTTVLDMGGMESISSESKAIPRVDRMVIPRTWVIRLKTRSQLVSLGQDHRRCNNVPGPPPFLQHLGDTSGKNLDIQCAVQYQQSRIFG